MHRSNRLIALLLTLALTFSVSVEATPGAANFEKKTAYTEFSDVQSSSWYYQNVKSVCELGLMNGKGGGKFDPDGSLTNAEVFTLAARLHAVWNTGKAEFRASEPWYQTYADYTAKNIRDISGFEPSAAATRLGFARILAKALPESALGSINRVDSGAIPDVADSAEVYLLYRAGILTGSDAVGSFLPDSGIKRSEAAAIIARMADPSLRKSVTLEKSDAVSFETGANMAQGTKLVVDSYDVTDFPSWYAGKIITDTNVKRGGKPAYSFTATDGAHSMMFDRKLNLKPDTVYKITLEMKTESVAGGVAGQSHAGAYLRGKSFAESKLLSGTNDWTTLILCETSDADGVLEFSVNLGYYTELCTGKVWFTDAKVSEANDYPGYESSFDASEWGDKKHISTSLYEENKLDFSISGSRLTVKGRLEYKNLDSLWIRCGSEEVIFDAASGMDFEKSLSIPDDCEVTIYARRAGESLYWGYIWDQLYIESDGNGYSFAQSPVLAHNLAEQSKPRNPSAYISYALSDAIVAKSDEIVGNAPDDYEKLLRIHDWVADNIYYDWDYYTGSSSGLYWLPDEVLREKRTVCEGYARLTQALVQAQGIPCMLVVTFATGVSTSGGFYDSSNAAQTEPNHKHIEAYVDGRWVTVDTTWDSGNKYENGQFEKGAFKRTYFDMTPDFFAFSHKILNR